MRAKSGATKSTAAKKIDLHPTPDGDRTHCPTCNRENRPNPQLGAYCDANCLQTAVNQQHPTTNCTILPAQPESLSQTAKLVRGASPATGCQLVTPPKTTLSCAVTARTPPPVVYSHQEKKP